MVQRRTATRLVAAARAQLLRTRALGPITVPPPSTTGGAFASTVTNRQSGRCLDVTGASTVDGAAVIQWACNGGANQQFTLRKVTYSGNDPADHQLVARHSGKCVDVSGICIAPRAVVHQWTCNPAGQGSPLNQTWRLPGR